MVASRGLLICEGKREGRFESPRGAPRHAATARTAQKAPGRSTVRASLRASARFARLQCLLRPGRIERPAPFIPTRGMDRSAHPWGWTDQRIPGDGQVSAPPPADQISAPQHGRRQPHPPQPIRSLRSLRSLTHSSLAHAFLARAPTATGCRGVRREPSAPASLAG